MLRVLITGSEGQLGSCIKDISQQYEDFISFVFTDYTQLDITDNKKIKAYFEKYKFDYCINCAAYTAVDKAEEEIDKAFSINAEATKNLAESCLLFETVLIHVSTDFVFDGKKLEPYTELDSPNPINVYGASKLKGEEYVEDILNKYFIIRTSWVYSEYGKNFVKTMLRLATEKNEISVVNDQIGSPTYAGDLANFILRLVYNKNKMYGLYHYSNFGKISWYDFAVEIFKQTNISIITNSILSIDYKTPATRPENSCLNKDLTLNTFEVEIPFWTDSLRRVLKVLN